ncbi:type-F conjugative transfer system pilin acetylase TraX [Escherichia coli]|nr:type-F conjugative transfer system pilin acetylase TraX [Escherichia coli]
MSLIKSLLFTLLLAAAAVQASTRDEIERLWNPQGMAAQPAQPAAGTSARTEKPAPRWFRLSNGRQVNLADWKVVLFMQGHCPYCHQFDPVLKQLAQQYGFSVFPYTLDGQGDTAFPEALPVPPDVMQTFFPNIPVSGTSYGIAGLLMLAVSHRLYRAEDRMERLVLVACLLAVIPALNLATSDAAAVAGLVMTVLTVGLVSCAGKSLPRFWPGDFFPTFYACHLAVLGVLAL